MFGWKKSSLIIMHPLGGEAAVLQLCTCKFILEVYVAKIMGFVLFLVLFFYFGFFKKKFVYHGFSKFLSPFIIFIF